MTMNKIIIPHHRRHAIAKRKAQELQTKTAQKQNQTVIGLKVEELIQNYLTPTIKQLNKKKKRIRTKSNKQTFYLEQNNVPQLRLSNHAHPQSPDSFIASPPYQPPPNIHNNYHMEPGQAIDAMTNYSEKMGNCCRKFITSLFCGCGMFQTIGIIVVLLTFGMIFVFYRATEITLILRELNHWKELSVKRVEYELASEQKLAQIHFDLDVDADKLKLEHSHREKMEIIEAKRSLTKEFIDRNTRTVTTTYWNLLTTETETVSQTIFSEDDIAFFQNNILYYGFNGDKAIESPQRKKEIIDKEQKGNEETMDNETNLYDEEKECGTAQCLQDEDSFDSI